MSVYEQLPRLMRHGRLRITAVSDTAAVVNSSRQPGSNMTHLPLLFSASMGPLKPACVALRALK